jgi:hypothetical protein
LGIFGPGPLPIFPTFKLFWSIRHMSMTAYWREGAGNRFASARLFLGVIAAIDRRQCTAPGASTGVPGSNYYADKNLSAVKDAAEQALFNELTEATGIARFVPSKPAKSKRGKAKSRAK